MSDILGKAKRSSMHVRQERVGKAAKRTVILMRRSRRRQEYSLI